MGSRRSIPDRWLPYKAYGKVIDGTRIICFKVPLRESVQRNFPEIWDIKNLLAKIPKLGAVIDLTNTARYYNPSDLEEAGVLHKKILMPGRILPPEDKVKEFSETLDDFLGRDCDFLIGVHCTHGLNRTGYMVCRYMRDRMGISAAEAIKRFEEARGYEIERKNYTADLLGKRPPPPDVGKHTAVKPTSVNDDKRKYKNDMTYRSPLNQSDGYEYSQSRYGRNRDDRGRSSNANNFWSSDRNDSRGGDRNWRSRGENEGGGSGRAFNRHRFDYKNDY